MIMTWTAKRVLGVVVGLLAPEIKKFPRRPAAVNLPQVYPKSFPMAEAEAESSAEAVLAPILPPQAPKSNMLNP